MIVNAAQTGLDALLFGAPASSGESGGEEFFSLLSSIFAGTDAAAICCAENGDTGETCVAGAQTEFLESADSPECEFCGDETGLVEIDDSVVMPAVLFLSVPAEEGTGSVSIWVSGVEGAAFRTTEAADGKARIAIPVEVTVSYDTAGDDGSDGESAANGVCLSALLLLDEQLSDDAPAAGLELVLLPDSDDPSELDAAEFIAGVISTATPLESYIPESRIVNADEMAVTETANPAVPEVIPDDGGYGGDTVDAVFPGERRMAFRQATGESSVFRSAISGAESDDLAEGYDASAGEETDVPDGISPWDESVPVYGEGDTELRSWTAISTSVPAYGEGEIPAEMHAVSGDVPDMAEESDIPVFEAESASGGLSDSTDVPIYAAEENLNAYAAETQPQARPIVRETFAFAAGMDAVMPEMPSPEMAEAGYPVSGETVDARVDARIVTDGDAGWVTAEEAGLSDEPVRGLKLDRPDFAPFSEAQDDEVSIAEVRTLFSQVTADDGTVRLSVTVRPETRTDSPYGTAPAEVEADTASAAGDTVPLPESEGDTILPRDTVNVLGESDSLITDDVADVILESDGAPDMTAKDGYTDSARVSRSEGEVVRNVSRTMRTGAADVSPSGEDTPDSPATTGEMRSSGKPAAERTLMPGEPIAKQTDSSAESLVEPALGTVPPRGWVNGAFGDADDAAGDVSVDAEAVAGGEGTPMPDDVALADGERVVSVGSSGAPVKDAGEIVREGIAIRAGATVPRIVSEPIAEAGEDYGAGVSVNDADTVSPAVSAQEAAAAVSDGEVSVVSLAEESTSEGTIPARPEKRGMGGDSSPAASREAAPAVAVRITRMTRENGFMPAEEESAVMAGTRVSPQSDSTSAPVFSEIVSAGSAGEYGETGVAVTSGMSLSTSEAASGTEPTVFPAVDSPGTRIPPAGLEMEATAETGDSAAYAKPVDSFVPAASAYPSLDETPSRTAGQSLPLQSVPSGDDFPEISRVTAAPGDSAAIPAAEVTVTPEVDEPFPQGDGGTRRVVTVTPGTGFATAKGTMHTIHPPEAVRAVTADGVSQAVDAAAGEAELAVSDSVDTVAVSGEEVSVPVGEDAAVVRDASGVTRARETRDGGHVTVVAAGSADGDAGDGLSGGSGETGTGFTERGMASSAGDGGTFAGEAESFGDTLSRKTAQPDAGNGTVIAAAPSAADSAAVSQAADARRTIAGEQARGSAETGENVLNTIVRQARVLLGSGQSSATVVLDPPSLGRLRLEIVTEGSKVSGKIVVESKEVQDIVRNNITELRQNLSQNGLQVESFDVQVGHNGGTDGWAQREDMESLASLARSSRERKSGASSGASPVAGMTGRGDSRHAGSLDVWM